jgi:Zn-dependent protease with chaperone function
MIEVSGFYYDGKTAGRTEVAIRFHENGLLEIISADFKLDSSLKTARISPRIGNTCRSIYLADGGKLESFANNELDVVADYFSQNIYQAFVHKLEKKLHYVIASLAITVLVVWAGIEFGVPLVAKSAAYAMPFTVEQNIGKQGLETLDKVFFQTSQLPASTKQQLTHRFHQAILGLPHAKDYQLEFRSSKELGANALALPGGIIIVTDELVKLADNDEQILAVLGHETGHVVNKHGLRSLFQDSFTALLMAGLLGDVSSISSLAVTLPTILVESRYSRKFEMEADDYAVVFLKNQHIAPMVFAQILTHLQKSSPHTDNEFDYLSSHPAMAERIDRISNKK